MSVPRKAFCTFRGEMTWLRRLSQETFLRLNPEWSLEVLDIPPLEDFPHMTVPQRSDLLRYRKLAKDGGLYFDTDMVWIKPIPEEWLQYDVGVTVDPITRFSNIGILLGSPDNRFWRDVTIGAIKRYRTAGNKFGYQLLGVCMLNRMFWRELGLVSQNECEESFGNVAAKYPDLTFLNFPERTISPIIWTEIRKLYMDRPYEPPAESVAVHWFGGHKESKAFSKRVTRENIDTENCYLAKAIRSVLCEPSGVQ